MAMTKEEFAAMTSLIAELIDLRIDYALGKRDQKAITDALDRAYEVLVKEKSWP